MSTLQEQQELESKLQILFDASATLIGSLKMEELLPKVLDLRVAGALTNLAASAVETAELHQQREQARVRNEFLAEASAALASSLDYEVTLAAVARLAVPEMAEWCVVDMARRDGALKRL